VDGSWLVSTIKGATVDQLLETIEAHGNGIEPDSEPEKVAKMFMLLSLYCGMKGYSLIALAEEKHRINKTRTWGSPDPVTGVIRHVD
jgi:hypothetical protein